MGKEIVPDTKQIIYEDNGDILFAIAPKLKPKKGGDPNALSPKTETLVSALTDEKNTQQSLPIVSISNNSNKE